jgi:hypothetical protein
MRRKSTKIAMAVAAAAVIATGGAALTESNVLPADTIAGYNTTSVSGATVDEIIYGLNPDGTQIVSAKLTFATDMTDRLVTAGFDGDVNLRSCDITGDPKVVTCSGFTQSTSAAQHFHVAVTEDPAP